MQINLKKYYFNYIVIATILLMINNNIFLHNETLPDQIIINYLWAMVNTKR